MTLSLIVLTSGCQQDLETKDVPVLTSVTDGNRESADVENVSVPELSTEISPGKTAGEVREFLPEGVRFCWCPPGKFLFGTGFIGEDGSTYNPYISSPIEVTLTRGYWMGQYEVTQGLWNEIMSVQPWMKKTGDKVLGPYQQLIDEICPKGDEMNIGPDYPALCISWNMANEFCQKLTQRERDSGRLPNGWEYSLPTEAEWEYASRAGSNDLFHFGNDINQLREYAWYDGTMPDRRYPQKVGLKKPNAWNIYDMLGNVAEHALDHWKSAYPGGIDPIVESNDRRHPHRGGAFCLFPSVCFNYSRGGMEPDNDIDWNGFRIALVNRVSITESTGLSTPE